MYTPLYVKTNYSLLSSLIKLDDLISYALKNNIKKLALTDSNMYMTIPFYKKCLENDIKPIIGLEVEIDNNIILLYAKNYNGYKNLIKVATKLTDNINLNDLINNSSDLICIVPYKYKDFYNIIKNNYKDIYIGYSSKFEESLASNISDNIVFLRKSLYIYEKDKEYLKYLYMIKDAKVISDDITYDVDNYSLDINNIDDYTSNKNLENTNIIGDMCDVKFPKSEILLPIYSDTNGLSSFAYLKELASFGLNKRLNNKVTYQYVNRLNYELDVINKMGFSNYFLVVYDYIKYAKKNNILVGPGRGSGAGSLVCYSLGITEIDPLKYNLLFERFLNPERISMPDIDTDFPDVDRDKVIEYVKNKYGSSKVSGIITFGTLASKQSIRDIARIFLIPAYQVSSILKRIPSMSKKKLIDLYKEDDVLKSIIDTDPKLKQVYKIASFIEDYPRHTSIHAAGIVISKIDLVDIVPLTKQDDNFIISYDKDYLEELGLLKMDFLGLKTLTIISDIIKDINKYEKKNIEFNKIDLNDKNVFNIFKQGLTLGIFQFESNGMQNFLKKLKPDNLEDIFSSIALYRPGPSFNIDSFVNRRHNKEKIDYIDESLIDILKPTYGIIVYQEQIMQIASTFSGFTLGEADVLRKAMSKKKASLMVKYKDKFISGAINNNHSRELALKVYDLILKFSGYGFNRSHSVAYSIVAYKMAYLKYYFPKYFYANLLTNSIGNSIKELELINEAKKLNIKIIKPDINNSDVNYKVYNNSIYYPLSSIKGIGVINATNIVNNKGNLYESLFDFLEKNKDINKNILTLLIRSGALDIFKYSRKTLIMNIDELLNYKDLVFSLGKEYVLKPIIKDKGEYTTDELLEYEKELFGMYLGNHPTNKYKVDNNTISLANINNYFNKNINTIALVDSIKIITTKNNKEMMFLDCSDESGKITYIVFPKEYLKYKDIKEKDIIKVYGNVERRFDSFEIVVDKLDKLN